MRLITEQLWPEKSAELDARVRSLASYRGELARAAEDRRYRSPESALALSSDEALHTEVDDVVGDLGDDVQLVCVAGIGGSSLGARAVLTAVRGRELPGLAPVPQVLFFESVEPRLLGRVRELFAQYERAQHVVLVIASKSGSTMETRTNADILYAALTERFGADAANAQTIVVGAPDAPLVTRAQGRGMRTILQPSNVGGRFSVASAVGLVPLALAGVDTHEFTRGVQGGVLSSVHAGAPSAAALLAGFVHFGYEQGLMVHELFLFHSELEDLGLWYRQLLAESIGKQNDNGERVGVEPSVALGSTDLHSLGQLVFGGPQRRLTAFVAAPDLFNGGPMLSSDELFVSGELHARPAGTVPGAIYEGVQQAYADAGLPCYRIELSDLSAREIGAFMGLHMVSIMYLAKLFGVNAFDQPAVESYKQKTRAILTAHSMD